MKMQHASRIALWLLLSAVQVMADSDSDSNDSSDGDGSGSGSGGEAPAAKGGMSGNLKFTITLVVVFAIVAGVGIAGHFLGFFDSAPGGSTLFSYGADAGSPGADDFKVCAKDNWEDVEGDWADATCKTKCTEKNKAKAGSCRGYGKRTVYTATANAPATKKESCVLKVKKCSVATAKEFQGTVSTDDTKSYEEAHDNPTTKNPLTGICEEDINEKNADLASCTKSSDTNRFFIHTTDAACTADRANGCCRQVIGDKCTTTTSINNAVVTGTCTEWKNAYEGSTPAVVLTTYCGDNNAFSPDAKGTPYTQARAKDDNLTPSTYKFDAGSDYAIFQTTCCIASG